DGLLRRSDAEVNERIALACFLRLHVLGHVEIDDRARETRGERRDVERLDRPNAALAVANVSPAFAYGVTDGRDQPESCDYDSSLRHALGPLFRREMRSTYQAGLGFVLLGQDVVDGLLNSRDLFSVLVRNFGFELLLQSHHELHRIQGLGAQ